LSRRRPAVSIDWYVRRSTGLRRVVCFRVRAVEC
jgi:hypothetical protein